MQLSHIFKLRISKSPECGTATLVFQSILQPAVNRFVNFVDLSSSGWGTSINILLLLLGFTFMQIDKITGANKKKNQMQFLNWKKNPNRLVTNFITNFKITYFYKKKRKSKKKILI